MLYTGKNLLEVLYTDQDVVTILCRGEVAEWSNATVLKTVRPARVSGVRIPPSPPFLASCI
jgi:hypothetical protein